MSGRIPPDAFEYYVGLGPERSYQAVADHYGVTKRAVVKHASKRQWSARLAKIEAEARERSDKRLASTIEEMRSRHLKTLRAMNQRALQALQQYPLNSGMEAMRAAEMAIKLERLIAGEPSERTAVSVEEVTRREINSFLEVAEEEEEDDDGDEGDDGGGHE